ncbi:MAG: rhamnan synthesis F family protein [Actinomycetota bacterium]|nr:rhamnan synthesis F family protein [Actinomycetota bacterium]
MTSRRRSILSAVPGLRGNGPPRWLTATPWFDAAWYTATYPDVAGAGADALQHYWQFGMAEGRSPGPSFDALRYEASNPAARGRALQHYLREVVRGSKGQPPAPGDVRAAHHPELESGLFDARWYRRRYPDAAHRAQEAATPVETVDIDIDIDIDDRDAQRAAALDAATYVEYYRHARTELHHPGPLFDAVEYVARRPEARDTGTPLQHFLAAMPAGEHARVLAQPTDRGPLAQPRIAATRPAPGGPRICVMIHAFYPDVLPELLRSVSALAGRATLLVNVCDAAHVAAADRAITDVLGAGTDRVVRCSPNRGRNFAPLFCTFAAEVRAHELLLHLHTKKSLYGGSERVDWRGHLLRALTGPVVPAVLDLFASDPEVGVLHPSVYDEMPPWSAHWLGNVPHGRALFQRCGLDPAEVDGYVDYPVGGMFWARVDALLPLLDAGLTLDDFELEAGQTDCTLAHAVERTITPVARSRGYRFVEFDYGAAQWRLGWGARNTDSFGIHDVELLRRQFALSDLVSVDVFDTLVLRPTLAPTSLQYFAARTLTNDAAAAEQMVQQRIAAEHQARVNRPELGDVTLAEVYSELPPALAPLHDAEVAIESRVAVPRQWLLDELHAAKRDGLRMVVMTDTTLDRATIQALLEHVGAGSLFDELYVSNERRARKDAGGMWPLVGAEEGVSPDRWLHLGDNERSDIQQALTHRVGWSHIASPRAVAQFYAPDARLERGNWATQSLLGLSACALYLGVPPAGDPAARAADGVFGYGVLGPIVASFIGHVLRHHAQHPDRRLLLLARDTGLVHEVLDELRPLLGDVAPQADYFLVSRRAALAVTQAAGLQPTLVLDSGAFEGVFADMVHARTGLYPPEDHFQAVVSFPADRELCATLLAELAEPLAAQGQAELAGLQRYLQHLGIDERTPLSFIDLGYAATTQRALARVLPNDIAGVYCATTPAAATAAGPGQSAHGYFADGVPFWTGNWFIDNSLLLEALLSATHGQVVGYRPDPDQPGDPTFHPASAAPHGRPTDAAFARLAPASMHMDVERIRGVQLAARRFCTDLVGMYGPAVLTDPIDPAAVLHWVQRIPRRFLPPPAELFAGLRIENGFVGRPADDASVGAGD